MTRGDASATGTRDDPTEKTTPAQQDLDNSVTDCTVTRVAQEYRGHPGLLIGFTRGSRIEHNEISHVPCKCSITLNLEVPCHLKKGVQTRRSASAGGGPGTRTPTMA